MATEKQVILPRRLLNKATTRTAYSKYPSGSTVPDNNIPTSQVTATALRSSYTSNIEALRLLVRKNGNVGSSVFSFVEIAKSGISTKAYTTNTNIFNPEATAICKSVIAALDTVYDYSKGYSDIQSMDGIVETLLREAVITSQVAIELVLDKSRLPSRISPIATETVRWVSRGDGTVYPLQRLAAASGESEIELNIPTVWVGKVHRDLTRNYVTPMLEPSIDMAIYYDEFIDDMRRAVRISGHSRLVVTLEAEKILAALPEEAQDDYSKTQEFLEAVRSDVETLVKSMQPEDALVTYDSVEVDEVQSRDVKTDYTQLLTAISGMLATSLKSHPSILGLRLEGSQSLSNTESMVFLKIAKGIQRPVEEVLSRALTLAVRLYGVDAYVKVKFNAINLRPEDELEAYRTMRQARILELLSLGLITDEQAAEDLQIGSLPEGYTLLSGTNFQVQSSNNMATAVGVSKDPQGNALTPNTPKKAGGKSQ